MHRPHQLRLERLALIDWVADGNYTHALTLNTDRELSPARLKEIFSNFCHRFDRAVLRHRNMKTMPRELRLRAIAFPENLATNAHLHALADLTASVGILGERQALELARTSWLQSTRGAGSFHWAAAPDRGWAGYATKRYNGTYYLAADFWSS
jgi:hypothetical protein